MLVFEPCPIANIAMTDATPIIIPSIVRNERDLLLARARRDILNELPKFIQYDF
jgi:hypothetical protein